MKTLLTDIDELLARLEDFTHGKDGKDITKMRNRINSELNKPILKETLLLACNHTYTIQDAQWKSCSKCGDIKPLSSY